MSLLAQPSGSAVSRLGAERRSKAPMFEHRLLTEIGVLIVRSKGPLSTNDISALNVDADSNIEDNGAFMGFMICAARFHGWEDFEGAVLHCNFVRDHHQKISKVAFISDSNFLAALPELASHFISAKVNISEPMKSSKR